MKKIAIILIGALVLSACDSGPEDIIKDAYEAREDGDLDRWADLMCNKLSEEDKQAFQDEFEGVDIEIEDLKITQDMRFDDVHVPRYDVTYRVKIGSRSIERADRVNLTQRSEDVYCIRGISSASNGN